MENLTEEEKYLIGIFPTLMQDLSIKGSNDQKELYYYLGSISEYECPTDFQDLCIILAGKGVNVIPEFEAHFNTEFENFAALAKFLKENSCDKSAIVKKSIFRVYPKLESMLQQ